MKMKWTRAIGATLGCLAAAAALAQARATFTDKEGNMSITHYTDWSAKSVGSGVYQFVALGQKVIGTWDAQKLRIETSRIEGTAIRGPRGGLQLRDAKMSGGVLATIKRKSAEAKATQPQTVTVASSGATYTAADGSLKLTGGVKVQDEDPDARQSMVIDGSSAEIVVGGTPAPRGQALRSAVVHGPVTFALTAVRPNGGQPLKIKGKADLLDFRADQRTLTLTGNVEITGDDPLFAASIGGVTKAVVKFDENMQPVEVNLTGAPGVSRLKRLSQQARRGGART